jgi:hypothetical protein
MASPWFGSDVAASQYRASLRAAVVHFPLLALKISTTALPEWRPTAQHISNPQRLLKALHLQPNHIPPASSPPKTHITKQHKSQNEGHKPWPPAKMASPWFGSDVAARFHRATLRAAVFHFPLIASKISATALPEPLPTAQHISNPKRSTCNPTASLPLPSPKTHNTRQNQSQNKDHKPKPPAKMASPWFGNDVAARSNRASLRAAVVHFPLLASKISTTALLPLPPVQRISNLHRLLKALHLQPSRILLAFSPPKTHNSCTKQHQSQNESQKPWPPATMASPWFGSDVAVRFHRATLRAAVVHFPLLALKISTTALLPVPTAQRISNPQRLLKAINLQPKSIPPASPPKKTHDKPQHESQNQNDKPEPPAKMASPWFGSDVAAREFRASLRAVVDHALEQGACCAAAMRATKLRHSSIVAAAAAGP